MFTHLLDADYAQALDYVRDGHCDGGIAGWRPEPSGP